MRQDLLSKLDTLWHRYMDTEDVDTRRMAIVESDPLTNSLLRGYGQGDYRGDFSFETLLSDTWEPLFRKDQYVLVYRQSFLFSVKALIPMSLTMTEIFDEGDRRLEEAFYLSVHYVSENGRHRYIDDPDCAKEYL